jgi:plastocyanin
VRDAGSIYVRYKTWEEELYDLGLDPWELENRAADPSMADTLAARRGRLRQLCLPPPPGMTLPPASVDITVGPPGVTEATSATFEFSPSETPATFRCSLDGGPAQSCVAPVTYAGLAEGPHSFAVQVFDAIGGPGGSAVWEWSVVRVQRTVTVRDFAFSPSSTTVGMSKGVQWSFEGPSDHTATDTTPLGLFDSGHQVAGSTFLASIAWAGSFAYRCTIHPQMAGVLKVAPAAVPPAGGLDTHFTVTWGTGGPPAGSAFDVQIKRPGSARWVAWRTGVTDTTGDFVPDGGAGGYGFRARVRLLAGGGSAFSSPVVIAVTGR